MSRIHVADTEPQPQRFRKYETYVDTGVPWLGSIPSHWKFLPTKRFLRFTTGWTPPTGNDALYDGENLWANIGDLGPRNLVETEKRISDRAIRESRLQVSPAGSVLFSFKLSVGQVSIAGADMYTNEAIATFLPSEAVSPDYLYWAAPVYIPKNAVENIYGAQLLSRERIANAGFAVPTPAEQQAVARFLDSETKKLDQLIAMKGQVLDLLSEKQAALIADAVTKGLDPLAPMRDSGVGWLGKIPEHWSLVRLGQLCVVGNGSTPTRDTADYWRDGSYPWLTSAKINEQEIFSADEYVTEAALKECHLPKVRPGSVLVAITGEGQTRGRAALLSIEATISQHLAYLTPRDARLSSEYLLGFLHSQYRWLRSESSSGGSTRGAITCEDLSCIRLPVPPPVEQSHIAKKVRREMAATVPLVDKITAAIDRLREYRGALVTAAVTGKIDVRQELV